MGAVFRPVLAPTPERRSFEPTSQTFFIFKDALKPQTVVLVGALLQLALCALVPLRWAMVPPLILLLNSVVTTILQLFSTGRNAFTARSIFGRTTAQIPLQDGTFGSQPAAQGVVVFNLGIQFNHPLGCFAPGVSDIVDATEALHKELDARHDEIGFLGRSAWQGDDRPSNSTILTTYYFRDVEGLHKIAHEALHRQAWDRYHASNSSHIGIYHETFCVPARGWETVYVNCHPILLGRTAGKLKKDGGEMWVNSLVSADMPSVKTQYARLSRDEKGVPKMAM